MSVTVSLSGVFPVIGLAGSTPTWSNLLGRPFVTVTPNGGPNGDGGDYGPNTLGTVTAGIQEAINSFSVGTGGTIYIHDGIYNITSGIIIKALALELIMSRATILTVPNGFVGTVIEINDSALSMSKTSIRGGQLQEAGTPARNWTGIRLYSHSYNGIFYNDIQDLWVWDCNVGITLDVDSTTGFINNNLFSNVRMWHPKTAGILWNPTSTGHSYGGNTFSHVQIQIGISGNVIGFKNIDGQENTFLSCFASDAISGQKESNIVPTAIGTVIVGGAITVPGFFTNSGYATHIVDQWHFQ